ncbi:ArsR family transcriptional regulator [Streptococcus anginosus]|nr:ArsR family transcriptional regulator [Streptococcus anginosus]
MRRAILDLLKMGSLSAGEIAEHFELTGATISHHLNILKKADLILETRQKNYIYYELNTSVLEDIVVWLAELKGDKANED